MELRKASRQRSKLRLGLAGPSGSGKTLSALLIAGGMTTWDKVAVIDTENGRGDIYAGNGKHEVGEYNIVRLTAPFTVARYIEAIEKCEKAGMEVIIIDSVTHEWDGEGGLLEQHSKMVGNSFTNWAKITPLHNKFINRIIASKCHIITTVRKKQDYDLSQGVDGKMRVAKVGLKEIQRDGFEYELTVALELNMLHEATASKDNTDLFDGVAGFKITQKTGEELLKWCNDGSAPIVERDETVKRDVPAVKEVKTNYVQELRDELKKMGFKTVTEGLSFFNTLGDVVYTSFPSTEDEAAEILKRIFEKDISAADSITADREHVKIEKEKEDEVKKKPLKRERRVSAKK